MLTKIFEAYEYLGVVSTLNRSEGIVVIRGTVDTYTDIIEILPNLPFFVEICEEE
ncbi:MAG: DUF4911 domain-containing protein [Syntrophomonadaceae bacterium]|nr:DUF4911 domain-containing protein [Syntrophomonadaceae bacterium]